MMTISELRHLEGVKGNFGIVDSLHYGGASAAPTFTLDSQHS